MSRFGHPDITILTNDRDAAMALWGMANEAHDAGDSSFEMSERMQKAFKPERVHEIWLIVNDALKTGALLAAIYATLRTVDGLRSKTLSIRISSNLKISRDDKDRLESLGCEVRFEREATQISLPDRDSDEE